MLPKTSLVFLLFLVLFSHMIVSPEIRCAAASPVGKGGNDVGMTAVRKIAVRGSSPRPDGKRHN